MTRGPPSEEVGFLHGLVQRVAYETLSRKERKARHLDAAAHIEETFVHDEVAEVLASHYVAAYEAAPDADDAPAIRAKAEEMLSRAGERASSLGAPEEARRYYEQAAELADEPLVQAELIEQAGRLALRADRPREARELLERALALHSAAHGSRGMARVSAVLAEVDVGDGRMDEAAAPRAGHPGARTGRAECRARGRTRSARTRARVERPRRGSPSPFERALDLSERLMLPEVFVEALTSKGVALMVRGRLAEARILLEAASARAHAEQLFASALRSENNLAVVLESLDLLAEALDLCDRSAALARRRGDRRWESNLRTGGLIELFQLQPVTVRTRLPMSRPFDAPPPVGSTMLPVPVTLTMPVPRPPIPGAICAAVRELPPFTVSVPKVPTPLVVKPKKMRCPVRSTVGADTMTGEASPDVTTTAAAGHVRGECEAHAQRDCRLTADTASQLSFPAPAELGTVSRVPQGLSPWIEDPACNAPETFCGVSECDRFHTR